MCIHCPGRAAASGHWREGLQSRLPTRGSAQRTRAGCGASQQVLQASGGAGREGVGPTALLIVSTAAGYMPCLYIVSTCLYVLSVQCYCISAMSLHIQPCSGCTNVLSVEMHSMAHTPSIKHTEPALCTFLLPAVHLLGTEWWQTLWDVYNCAHHALDTVVNMIGFALN